MSSLAEKDEAALEDARASGDVTIHDWSDEERARFREIAAGEWEKVAEGSDNARKVYDTLTTYLREQGLLTQ